jgi:hypothetical protein
MRQVHGDSHLAQDVTQTVFAELASRSAALSGRPQQLQLLLFCQRRFPAVSRKQLIFLAVISKIKEIRIQKSLMGYISELDSTCINVRHSRMRNIRKQSHLNGSQPSQFQSAAAYESVIEKETQIVPVAVADSIWHEASFWFGEMLPRKWIAELAERAEVIYAHNPRFRKLLRGRGNSGRDWLWAFTRHWLSGLLIERRPSLAERLPSEYRIGRPFSTF